MHRETTRNAAERAQTERFEELYERAQSPVMLAIERGVCGCDYGGSSWTTVDEAERIMAGLGLRPGMRLLDLGAGSGWPGLYLAKKSGCDVMLVDLPQAGLRIATQRAKRDGTFGQVRATVADAAALPFRDGAFDAISHSDLLCCLRPKEAVLATCRRMIAEGGRMLFTVISVAPGLKGEAYRRAVANGPEFIETENDYPRLLAETGWRITDRQDITEAYATTCRRQFQTDEDHRDGLEGLLGIEAYAERLAGWRAKMSALKDDLLRRELFVAVPRS